jgi:hypothetical protein
MLLILCVCNPQMFPTMLSILFVWYFLVFLYVVVATVDVTDQTMSVYFSVPKIHMNINTNNKSCRISQMTFENDACTELGAHPHSSIEGQIH